MAEQAESLERVAHAVQLAYETEDVDSFAEFLDPAVTWGPPGDPRPPCQTREQVLEWYRRAQEAGASAHVSEVGLLGDRILLGLVVAETEEARGRGGRALRWQLLTVRAGLVVDIVGFEEKSEALAWASGSGP